MEPIVKELYLLRFQSRLELSSSYSRADGGGGGKETGTMNSTKEDSSKGGDPKNPTRILQQKGPLQDPHLEQEAGGDPVEFNYS